MFHGALFHDLVRMHVAAGLRRQGHPFGEAREMAASLTGTIIDAHAADVPQTVGAIGDGTHPILDAIIAFLNSPAGSALIAALIKLLLGGL